MNRRAVAISPEIGPAWNLQVQAQPLALLQAKMELKETFMRHYKELNNYYKLDNRESHPGQVYGYIFAKLFKSSPSHII